MVSNAARQFWRHVGQQYEEENEEDLKDRRDYLANVLPDRYPEGCKFIQNVINLTNTCNVDICILVSFRLLISITIYTIPAFYYK